MFFFAHFDITRAFVLGFGRLRILVFISIFGIAFHFMISYLLAIKFGYGLLGIGIGKSISDFVLFFFLTILVKCD